MNICQGALVMVYCVARLNASEPSDACGEMNPCYNRKVYPTIFRVAVSFWEQAT